MVPPQYHASKGLVRTYTPPPRLSGAYAPHSRLPGDTQDLSPQVGVSGDHMGSLDLHPGLQSQGPSLCQVGWCQKRPRGQ